MPLLSQASIAKIAEEATKAQVERLKKVADQVIKSVPSLTRNQLLQCPALIKAVATVTDVSRSTMELEPGKKIHIIHPQSV